MDSEESTALPDVAFEGPTFGEFDHRRSGSGQEDDRLVAAEPARGEPARIGRRIHPEAVFAAEGPDRADAFVDRRVAVAGRLGEHQDAVGPWRSGSRLTARRDEQHG